MNFFFKFLKIFFKRPKFSLSKLSTFTHLPCRSWSFFEWHNHWIIFPFLVCLVNQVSTRRKREQKSNNPKYSAIFICKLMSIHFLASDFVTVQSSEDFLYRYSSSNGLCFLMNMPKKYPMSLKIEFNVSIVSKSNKSCFVNIYFYFLNSFSLDQTTIYDFLSVLPP